jgi:hypothetical protein
MSDRFDLYEALTAERYSSITEEYQDGENSYCEFFGLVPFLQLAIRIISGATV